MLPTSLIFLISLTVAPVTRAVPISASSVPDELGNLLTLLNYTGQATIFEAGLGACGYTDVDSSYIVSLPSPIFGNGEKCDLYLEITNSENNKTAYGRARDECPSCTGAGDLDLSPGLFDALAKNGSEGELPIQWHFMAPDWSPISLLPAFAAAVISSEA